MYNVKVLKTIGIIGCGSGTGVTHLSIMLGNYLGSKEKKRIAIVEFNYHNEFEEIQKFYTGIEDPKILGNKFKIANTTYYKSVSKNQLPEILNEEYEYIIYDFGSDYAENENEFLRCGEKIVVGILSEWKHTQYEYFLDKTKEERLKGNWEYLSIFGGTNVKDSINQKYRIEIKQIPHEPDAFTIHGCNFEFFKELI